jgi:hypothetical protein
VPEPCENPIAVQLEAEGHVTANRKSPCAPPGLGLRRIVHLRPFQRSANVSKSEPLLEAPTAVQADRDEQLTPARNPNCAPDGFGVGWIRHALPSHRSTRVPACDCPTAMHNEGEAHVTPARPPPPCGLALRWILHAWPFHRSARVPPFEYPTATHDVEDVQVTP